MKSNLMLKAVAGIALGATAISAYATGSFVAATPNTIATEVFGTGSEETLITAANRTYNPTVAEPVVAGNVVTIKYTLGGGAVFGEVVNAGFFDSVTVTGAPALAVVKTAGGAIGDNTVTFQYTAAGAGTLTGFTFGGYKTKNLTSALKTAGGSVQLGVNYSGIIAANVNDSAPPTTLFNSAQGATLTVAPFFASPPSYVEHYINVADDSKLFTQSFGAAGKGDFRTPGLAMIQYGSVKLTSGPLQTNGTNVLREDLTRFVFQGGDKISLVLTGGAMAYKATPGGVVIQDAPCGVAPVKKYTGVVSDTKISFDLSGSSDADLNKIYNVCLTVDKVTEIEETTFAATAVIDYFNTRYVDETLSDSAHNFGSLKKNGVTQAIPLALSADNFFQTTLRVANTGSVTGKVKVRCTKNNGGAPVIGVLASSLAPNKANAFTASQIATACGANGAATASEYGYVLVIGEFDNMDAIEYLIGPGGTLNQLSTNNNQINSN